MGIEKYGDADKRIAMRIIPKKQTVVENPYKTMLDIISLIRSAGLESRSIVPNLFYNSCEFSGYVEFMAEEDSIVFRDYVNNESLAPYIVEECDPFKKNGLMAILGQFGVRPEDLG